MGLEETIVIALATGAVIGQVISAINRTCAPLQEMEGTVVRIDQPTFYGLRLFNHKLYFEGEKDPLVLDPTQAREISRGDQIRVEYQNVPSLSNPWKYVAHITKII